MVSKGDYAPSKGENSSEEISEETARKVAERAKRVERDWLACGVDESFRRAARALEKFRKAVESAKRRGALRE